jgi:hypothetical protein
MGASRNDSERRPQQGAEVQVMRTHAGVGPPIPEKDGTEGRIDPDEWAAGENQIIEVE